MGPTLSKQDMQNLLENTKNKIFERVSTRKDMQLLTEAARDRVMNYVHDLMQVHQQNMLRRGDLQNSQLTRRIASMETRMVTLEQELKAIHQLMERLASQPQQQVFMPLQPDTKTDTQPYTQYTYKPV